MLKPNLTLSPRSWTEWVQLQTNSFSQLIFAGLVKNAGKTTALNSINTCFSDHILGLTSLGYDGEDRDAIYNHPKPPISVLPGQLILTAERFLPPNSSARYTILEHWGTHPQFGSWLILRVNEQGRFRMAGPSSLVELQAGIARLRDQGATRVHIDGALNRLSHLTLADSGIILSTGAALGTLEQVVQRTAHVLRLFQLPVYIPTSILPSGSIPPSGSTHASGSTPTSLPNSLNTKLPLPAITTAPFPESAYLADNEWHALPPFLWTLNLADLLPSQPETLYLGGALTDRLYTQLLRARRLPRNLIVKTPAQILLSPATYQGLQTRGVNVQLAEPPNLIMLTLNSWHPSNPIPTDQLAEALIGFSHVPMVDIEQSKIWNSMEVNC